MLTDTHLETMIGAYRNISFDPERRGKQDFEYYNDLLMQDLIIVGQSNESYKRKFIDKLMLIYTHKSNTASAMIVGPAKFKTNTKRLNWERQSIERFSHWRDRYLRLVQRERRKTIDESKALHASKDSQYSKGRVKELEARSTLLERFKPFTLPCGGLVTVSNERLVITHESKPSSEVLAAIKKRGFKYSPKTKTWVRQFTGNALYSLDYLKQDLEDLK